MPATNLFPQDAGGVSSEIACANPEMLNNCVNAIDDRITFFITLIFDLLTERKTVPILILITIFPAVSPKPDNDR